MSEGRPKKGKPGESREHVDPPKMENGEFYDLNPPAHITSGVFRRVRCEERFPPLSGRGDIYMVSGVADGGTEIKRFPLEFRDLGVKVSPALEKNFLFPVSKPPAGSGYKN